MKLEVKPIGYVPPFKIEDSTIDSDDDEADEDLCGESRRPRKTLHPRRCKKNGRG